MIHLALWLASLLFLIWFGRRIVCPVLLLGIGYCARHHEAIRRIFGWSMVAGIALMLILAYALSH